LFDILKTNLVTADMNNYSYYHMVYDNTDSYIL